MKLSNGTFANAVAWIFENTDIKDQKTLAEVTGITETTISRILNDKVKQPSHDTILRLNKSFDNIFNMDYFAGRSVVMLNADVAYFQKNPDKSPFHLPENKEQEIPSWADSLINLVSNNTKATEALVRENAKLKESIQSIIEENKKLRSDLTNLSKQNNHQPVFYDATEESLSMAAEDINKN